jgi:hypothetical protein
MRLKSWTRSVWSGIGHPEDTGSISRQCVATALHNESGWKEILGQATN